MNKLIFDNVEVSKKEFYESTKPVNLGKGDMNKIVVSNKIKGNHETSKVFIGYRSDITDIVTTFMYHSTTDEWLDKIL